MIFSVNYEYGFKEASFIPELSKKYWTIAQHFFIYFFNHQSRGLSIMLHPKLPNVGVTIFTVMSIPPSVFYINGDDHKVLRFCFAKKEETLIAAAERLCKI
jgi:hypothetical protein